MKMKISKASWMILAAGVFIIVLAGLGLARSGQTGEYKSISENITLAEARTGNIQTSQYQTQIDELEEQLQDSIDQVTGAKDRLKQTILSVDVTDKFYEIADFCGVTVTNIGTTGISEQPYKSINCEMISLNAAVVGEKGSIIDFIIGLNNNYVTGYVRSANLVIGVEEDAETTASIQMTVYSLKGN